MIYGQGISREGELIDLAVKFEIVQKSGSWFSYKEERLCQGRDKLKDYLREHRELGGRNRSARCGRNFKGRLPPPGPRGRNARRWRSPWKRPPSIPPRAPRAKLTSWWMNKRYDTDHRGAAGTRASGLPCAGRRGGCPDRPAGLGGVVLRDRLLSFGRGAGSAVGPFPPDAREGESAVSLVSAGLFQEGAFRPAVP